jgi:hypothetical protein
MDWIGITGVGWKGSYPWAVLLLMMMMMSDTNDGGASHAVLIAVHGIFSFPSCCAFPLPSRSFFHPYDMFFLFRTSFALFLLHLVSRPCILFSSFIFTTQRPSKQDPGYSKCVGLCTVSSGQPSQFGFSRLPVSQ